jgi:hypothetical protein
VDRRVLLPAFEYRRISLLQHRFLLLDYFRDDHGWPISFITMGAPIVLLTIWAGPYRAEFSPRWLVV